MSQLGQVSTLAELDRCGLGYEVAGETEVKVICPFHPDKSPSCHVNVEKRCFKCHTSGCGAEGDLIALIARHLGQSKQIIYADMAKRYDFEDDTKIVDPQVVEAYHAAIWQSGPLLTELRKRGLTDTDIRRYRIGYKEDEKRITIPVKNVGGNFVNIRKYLPGAPGADKMRNLRGNSAPRLFPIDQLQYETVVVCGGECKAIVAASQLNAYNIGAVCVTAGEGNWEMKFNDLFKSKKRVYVCMDIDKGGVEASRKLCNVLSRVCTWVGMLILPLDVDKYPKGDINDYCGPSENQRLYPLIEQCSQYVPEQKLQYTTDEIPELSNLTKAIHADSTAKRITLSATVTALGQSPYIVPQDIKIYCSKDQNECQMCTVFLDNRTDFTVPAESPTILDLANSHKDSQLKCIKEAIQIPASCRVCSFEAVTFYNVEDVRISPQLEITNRNTERSMQPALCIGRGLELNESYNLTGRMFPHPKTQEATLLISSYTPTQDALSTYEIKSPETLSIFWPEDSWTLENIEKKLAHIYGDFEANVTRIYQRQDLHLTVDLVYHSPLFFSFDGKKGVKGWIEALVMGDSGHGKSTVSCGTDGNGGLMAHYGLGQRVECKNATVAGLLGGLQQMGTRWFVSWGLIPTHDRRLVVLEEVKGAHPDVISKLTDMRSSGTAEIPKIERRKTHARTRLLWISNPRADGMRLSQYNYGIEAVKELIGGLEDIRRFDFALLVGGGEVDLETMNKLQKLRPQVEHCYTSEACRNLILWAWTRHNDQVEFTEDATSLILSEATKFCEDFTDAIPLCDRGSMRLKIARMSASLAARLFSCSEDFQKLMIYPAHVEYICKFLRRIYSSPVCGYLDFSKAMKTVSLLIDPDKIKIAIKQTSFPEDLVKQMIAKNKIEPVDLEDWCGMERDLARDLLSLLVRKHALVRDGKAYRKSASFIDLLKEMLNEPFPPPPPNFEERRF